MANKVHDQLTARESEVLDLVARGLTNEEIAQRLGVSLDGAKYHVSQILSKLGVENRAQAAALRRGGRLSRWVAVPMLLKVGGAAFLVAAGVGLGAFGYAVLSTDGGTSDETLPFGVALEYEYDGDGPQVGDIWEVGYSAYAGNQRVPWPSPYTGWPMSAVRDSVISVEPTSEFEGEELSISRFFEWGGGVLTRDSFRMPGSDVTYVAGGYTPDGFGPASVYIVASPGPIGACGRPGVGSVYEFVAPEFVPHDGEFIRIYFQTEEGMRDFIIDPQATRDPSISSPASAP